jgi:hypothetical protein
MTRDHPLLTASAPENDRSRVARPDFRSSWAWRSMGSGRQTQMIVTFLLVSVVALAREGPLAYEEPSFYADPGPLFEPWNGALALFGRASFWAAHILGDPNVTRLIAAAVIGAVAVYLSRVSPVAALALPLLPTPYPGPYIGPLNSQWWFAIAICVMALERARSWHYVALVIAGLSGIGPCLMVPVFRDRRGLVLAATALIQVVVLITSSRRPLGHAPDPGYLLIATVLVVSLLFARLPMRTRLVFAYGGLAVLMAGLIAAGTLNGQGRYLAVPFAGIAIGLASYLRRGDGTGASEQA